MERLRLPISVKGIVFEDGRVWLRKNERDEWELPGGRMEPGEQPEETVCRELREELGFDVAVHRIVDAAVYIVGGTEEKRAVLVMSYFCALQGKPGGFEEYGEAGKAYFETFSISELDAIKMPSFYLRAIHLAWEQCAAAPSKMF